MPQQAYSYHQAPAFHRQPASHKTTSAFSSSANPNEDWTQMSNLAERRRIQNRIAQRNYRKKLKRRLEDLERRAGSLPVSPPQTYTKLKETVPTTTQNTRKQSSSSYSPEAPRTTYRQPQYTPPLQANDNLPLGHDLSNTTPLFSYAQSPPSDDPSLYTPYTPHCGLTDDHNYAPMALPQPTFKPKRADLNAFGISYFAMAGLDIPPHYDDPFTPPLIHAFDFDVVNNERAGYMHLEKQPRPLGGLLAFTVPQQLHALQIDVHAGDTVALKIDPPPAYPLPARLRRVGRLMPPLAQRLPVPAGCVVLPLEELNVALAVHAAFDHDVPGSVGAVQQLVEFVLLEDEEFTGSCHVNREWRCLDQWALLKLNKVVPAVGRGKG